MKPHSSPSLNTLAHYDAILEQEMQLSRTGEAPDSEIEQHLRNDLGFIFSRASIELSQIDTAYLIGSYSRNTQVAPFSDVDVLSFSSNQPHFETIMRWRAHLLTLYVYTQNELQGGIEGPDSLYWIDSLKDAIPIYGTNSALSEITARVQAAEQRYISSSEQVSLPLSQVRRLIEYRRKAYAELFSQRNGINEQDKTALLRMEDIGRKFVENYLLLKSRMMSRMIETETSIYDIVPNLSGTLQQAILNCMSGEELTAHEMDLLMNDIRVDISRAQFHTPS